MTYFTMKNMMNSLTPISLSKCIQLIMFKTNLIKKKLARYVWIDLMKNKRILFCSNAIIIFIKIVRDNGLRKKKTCPCCRANIL